ncbi:MAG: cellulase-like family protein [Bacteroidota bacterium]|jgi:hypothetical protein
MDFPQQVTARTAQGNSGSDAKFDCRELLNPPRLTIMMWDQAYLVRHLPGESFADYEKVLGEAAERGYNTVRIDPLPNLIDLERPQTILSWADPQRPYLPWGNCHACSGPVGKWLIEFMQTLLKRGLYYTLSTWWFDETNWCGKGGISPTVQRIPRDHREAADIWISFLTQWKKMFGFERLVYLDIHNEVPFFMKGYKQLLKEKVGLDWDQGLPFTSEQIDFLAQDINGAMRMLQREFPELRFTASIHGDERWLSVPLHLDCLDVHFYLDADQRWVNRTRFDEWVTGGIYTDDAWFKEFSDRCKKARNAVMPMLFQRQQQRLADFASWAGRYGMPLTTSESWSTWYYIDHPELEWDWLLEWAEMTVNGAIAHKMWGWTPHNYVQPQFENWKDVSWHRRLTSRFLNGK